MKEIDYSLYLVTDQQSLKHDSLQKIDLVQAVEQAIIGGVTLVQLREKNLDSRAFYHQALAIKAVCNRYHIPLLINDRIDIALAVEADGVHVGQSDLPAHVVRQMLGSDKIIGVSARSVQEARQAQADGADYLGVGAMFVTTTKNDAKTVSVETLSHIRQAVDLPIVAIGGINATTLPVLQADLDKLKTSVDGIAVVSAILASDNITHASQALKQRFLNH